MPMQKFTVFLIPDEDGYQVIVPHYPECTTWGQTPQQAFANVKEAMELILEVEDEDKGDTIPPNTRADHVIVGDIEVEVPASLASEPEKVSVEVTA